MRAFRRAEARGEIRGGRFIAGLVGEQFAMPDAVDAMRTVHRREATGDIVRVSACDPLNLVGILTPGPRVPAVLGNEVLYRDGVPVMPDATATPSATGVSSQRERLRVPAPAPDAATGVSSQRERGAAAPVRRGLKDRGGD